MNGQSLNLFGFPITKFVIDDWSEKKSRLLKLIDFSVMMLKSLITFNKIMSVILITISMQLQHHILMSLLIYCKLI